MNLVPIVVASQSAAMNDLGALFWRDAVVVMKNQTSRTLAARDAGLEAVALYHSQWYVNINACYWTRWAALVKHKAPLHRTAHSWQRKRERNKITRNREQCDVCRFKGSMYLPYLMDT